MSNRKTNYGPRKSTDASRSLSRAQTCTARQLKRDGPAAAFQDGKPVKGSRPRGKVTNE